MKKIFFFLLCGSFFSVMAEGEVTSPSGAQLDFDDDTLKGKSQPQNMSS